MHDQIIIRGARENNLKNIDLTLPRDKFIVFTGLSGSGKTSLAFDTIYAEGQRRYVESLSSYARQFLGQMEKPDLDDISGLSPAISIDQKTTSHNPRSTVGTVTEIHDYLRLLYARVGQPHCPKCGKPIERQSIDQMIDRILALGVGDNADSQNNAENKKSESRVLILAPLVRARKGENKQLFEEMRKNGYVRMRVDGTIYEIDDIPSLTKNQKHTVEVVVDRLVLKEGIQSRLADSLETALQLGGGLVIVAPVDGEDRLFSQNYACADCGVNLEELTPRMFSFNNPYGACPTCSGLGSLLKIDPELIIPNKALSLREGAIQVSGWNTASKDSIMAMYLKALSDHYDFSTDVPVSELPKEIVNILLYGTGKTKLHVEYQREFGSGSFDTAFEGIAVNLERRYHETQSDSVKSELEEYMSNIPCPDCGGKRLRPESICVTIGERSIADISDMSIYEARRFFETLELSEMNAMIAKQILKEIDARLGFLVDVGLNYLTLSRMAGTLSGGEAQRIRLATQIGSGLVGVLYILDEPSIGLHQRDNAKLLKTLEHLRDLGNTLIVVEHDEETMRTADHIVDIGPLAGVHGGELVAQGTVDEIIAEPRSITGEYLSGRKRIELPETRRELTGKWLTVKGASENNLRGLKVKFPLGVFTCVTGVSGSGKSSLVNHILFKALARDLNRAKTKPGKHEGIDGVFQLDKIIDIDQSPIGRTPRSNPATYSGLFDLIRDVFASTPDARMRGYSNGRFSFNVKGGRCESCKGDGIIKIEMHFLPDIYVPCEVCKGARYNRETLEVRYKGKNISDVLNMTVEDALEFFGALPRLKRKLQTLFDVGLGYIKLGQPSTTLSGGEAQRVKLATELSRRSTGKTMYILDEPTTGLHIADVHKLIHILQKLCEGGNTVLVIEHNLDVIKTADHIIDMGPEGGDKGGEVVAEGTPEEVAKVEKSYTGRYLKGLV